jgi:predicted ester cyclase
MEFYGNTFFLKKWATRKTSTHGLAVNGRHIDVCCYTFYTFQNFSKSKYFLNNPTEGI